MSSSVNPRMLRLIGVASYDLAHKTPFAEGPNRPNRSAIFSGALRVDLLAVGSHTL